VRPFLAGASVHTFSPAPGVEWPLWRAASNQAERESRSRSEPRSIGLIGICAWRNRRASSSAHNLTPALTSFCRDGKIDASELTAALVRLGISNPKKEDVDVMIWELDEENEHCVKWHHFEINIDRIHNDKVMEGK
jgi:Ca2+-binding EF-hand superfamily protein